LHTPQFAAYLARLNHRSVAPCGAIAAAGAQSFGNSALHYELSRLKVNRRAMTG
jgi:hypothetical protein